MTQTIMTNVASLNSQRQLNKSQSMLNTSLERLSSGLRINSAKDDAAGLAISDRMTAQINGMTQAARNANDGISLAQTAEAALGSVTTNLQRIRELAVQSSNATNKQADRDSIDVEVQQLKQEIQRVADQTSFNGVKLLNGSLSNANFQVGADANQIISIGSVANVNLAALGGTTNVTTVQGNASDITTLTAITAGTLTVTGNGGAAVDIGAIAAAGNSTERAGQIVAAINLKSAQSGVGASYDGGTGKITLSSTTGSITTAGFTDVTTGVVSATTAATPTVGIAATNVQSETNAQLTIIQMDAALAEVDTARANLGAIQNRFTSAVSNLASASENISAARSRIQDTDFAAETAAMSKANILQQAGTAMLAQANSAPQNVLSLLK